MQLKDILSNVELNKLKGVKKSSKGRLNDDRLKSDNIREKSEKNNLKEDRVTYKENRQNKESVKKRYISLCPLCGRDNLEITSNGYYYCDDCGIKVEKR